MKFNTISESGDLYLENLGFSLEQYVKNLKYLWINQTQCLLDISKLLKNGNSKGLIIQPGGAGKSKIIGETIKGISKPSLILVHQSDETELMKQKIEGILGGRNILTINKFSKGTTTEQYNNAIGFLNNLEQGKVVISTYAGLRSLYKTSKEIFENFFGKIHFIASDEAHESLGEVTKKSYDFLDELNINDLEKSNNITEELEGYLQENYSRLHLFFTATPQLSNKRVDKVHDLNIINHYTFGNLVTEGKAIIPQDVNIGRAIYITTENTNLSDNEINLNVDKFIMESGEKVSDIIIQKYISLLDKHNGKLPAIAFCSNIIHAEKVKKELEINGIRAVRCTVGNSKIKEGISLIEAKKMMEKGKIDVIVTVKKAAQSLDIKGLQVRLGFSPKYSVKDYLQSLYRVTRINNGKNRENTYNIEPEWIVASDIGKKWKKKTKNILSWKNPKIRKNIIKINGKNLNVLYKSKHYLNTLLEIGEINKEQIISFLSDIEYQKLKPILPALNVIKENKTLDVVSEKKEYKKRTSKKILVSIDNVFKKVEDTLSKELENDKENDLNIAFENHDLNFIKKYIALELIDKVSKLEIDWENNEFSDVYSYILLEIYEKIEKNLTKMKHKSERFFIYQKIFDKAITYFANDYNYITIGNLEGIIDNNHLTEEEKIFREESLFFMSKAINSLSKIEKEVMEMRFGLNGIEYSLEEISEKFKISREKIRLVETGGIKSLRSLIKNQTRDFIEAKKYLEPICLNTYSAELLKSIDIFKETERNLLNLMFDKEYFTEENLKKDLKSFASRLGYTKFSLLPKKSNKYGEFADYNQIIIKAQNGLKVNLKDYLTFYGKSLNLKLDIYYIFKSLQKGITKKRNS